MNLEYGEAPMHYIDGIPAYKTGEWYGHKSCKFGPTRRVVKQISDHNFSLADMEGQVGLMARKRRVNHPTSNEYVFRPSFKPVKDPIKIRERIESIKPVTQNIKQAKIHFERKHKFDYITERDFIQKEIVNKKNREDFVHEEFKNIGKVGFARPKNYMNLITKSKYRVENLTSNEDYIPRENPGKHNIWNVKDDINYVRKLVEFESRFLPDIKVLNVNDKIETNNGNANTIISNNNASNVNVNKDQKKTVGFSSNVNVNNTNKSGK